MSTKRVEREKASEKRLVRVEELASQHDQAILELGHGLQQLAAGQQANADKIGETNEHLKKQIGLMTDIMEVARPVIGLNWFLTGIGKAIKSPAAWGATAIMAFMYSLITGDFAGLLEKL